MTVLDASLEPPERPDFRRYGRWHLPLVIDPAGSGKWLRYRRASNAGNILDDEYNLEDWKRRTAIVGAAQRPDIMAQVSVLSPEADITAIRDFVEQCIVSGKGLERAGIGTAIHAMLDHVDLNHDWTPAPNYVAGVDAYREMLDVYGLVPIDVEVKCVNDEYKIAGTMDRRYRTMRSLLTPDGRIIPIGTVLAGDTKTGKKLEYASGSYCTQLAAYVGSVRYDVVTNERMPFDPPTFPDWALIVHVDADDGRCDLFWSDMDAGRYALELAENVRGWRRRTDLIVPARIPLRALPQDDADARQRHPAASSTVPPQAPDSPVAGVAGTARSDTPATGTEALAAVRTWLRERINLIRQAGDAPTAMLLREWPTGVSGLKYDNQTAEQLDAISEACWRVEKEYSLSFPTADPRTPVEERDFAERWRKPTGKDAPADEQAHLDFNEVLNHHPRQALLRDWTFAITLPENNDGWALLHALCEFAMLPQSEWSDADVTEMLDGTLRAIGYDDGIRALGSVTANHAPLIMSSAFAITAGSALLLYGEDGKPVVRTIDGGKS